MNIPTPEACVGKRVVDPSGDEVGTVVDVGLTDWSRPKFFLVRLPEAAADGTDLVRVGIADVDRVDEDGVLLRVPLNVDHLPA